MEVNERYKSKNEEAIKITIEYILQQGYGAELSKHTLGKMLGYNIEDELQYNRFVTTMNKVKNLLIDKGFILKSIGRTKYYVLKPNQISSFAVRNYVVKPLNMYDKAKRILNHTDTNKLNSLSVQEHSEATELASNIKEIAEEVIDTSKYWNNKENYKENDYDREI